MAAALLHLAAAALQLLGGEGPGRAVAERGVRVVGAEPGPGLDPGDEVEEEVAPLAALQHAAHDGVCRLALGLEVALQDQEAALVRAPLALARQGLAEIDVEVAGVAEGLAQALQLGLDPRHAPVLDHGAEQREGRAQATQGHPQLVQASTSRPPSSTVSLRRIWRRQA